MLGRRVSSGMDTGWASVRRRNNTNLQYSRRDNLYERPLCSLSRGLPAMIVAAAKSALRESERGGWYSGRVLEEMVMVFPSNSSRAGDPSCSGDRASFSQYIQCQSAHLV